MNPRPPIPFQRTSASVGLIASTGEQLLFATNRYTRLRRFELPSGISLIDNDLAEKSDESDDCPIFHLGDIELSAGEALDSWIQSEVAKDFGNCSMKIHVFADAVSGYRGPLGALANANIILCWRRIAREENGPSNVPAPTDGRPESVDTG